MDNVTAETKKAIERVFKYFKNSHAVLRPHFILTGPSGAGKTFLIKTLADQYNINMFEINAASLTKEGSSGSSISKVLTPLLTCGDVPTIVFVDEFDKLFISGNSNATLAHEVTTGVQNEFLKILESETTKVYENFGHYVDVNVSNCLFIFTGTFNGEPDIDMLKLKEFGVKTEFLGRVSSVFAIKKFTPEKLMSIAEQSDLLDTYLKLTPGFKKEKCIKDLKEYIESNYANNIIGARMVNQVINNYFINGGKL